MFRNVVLKKFTKLPSQMDEELRQRFSRQRQRLKVLECQELYRDSLPEDEEDEDGDFLACWKKTKHIAVTIRDVMSFLCSSQLFAVFLDVFLQLLFVVLVSSVVLVLGSFSVIVSVLSRAWYRGGGRRSTTSSKTLLMRTTLDSTYGFVMGLFDKMDMMEGQELASEEDDFRSGQTLSQEQRLAIEDYGGAGGEAVRTSSATAATKVHRKPPSTPPPTPPARPGRISPSSMPAKNLRNGGGPSEQVLQSQHRSLFSSVINEINKLGGTKMQKSTSE